MYDWLESYQKSKKEYCFEADGTTLLGEKDPRLTVKVTLAGVKNLLKAPVATLTIRGGKKRPKIGVVILNQKYAGDFKRFENVLQTTIRMFNEFFS